MKSHPMLFSAPMVRAILQGRKTMTRRVVKPPTLYRWIDMDVGTMVNSGGHKKHISDLPKKYAVGDEIWVRETFGSTLGGNSFVYKADNCLVPKLSDKELRHFFSRACTPIEMPEKWTPSIHMPRKASRITLKVTGVRVERLNDISEDDAIAEGSFLNQCGCKEMQRPKKTPLEIAFRQTGCHIHGTEFRALWESIHGPGAWSANPWVTVVEFERIKS